MARAILGLGTFLCCRIAVRGVMVSGHHCNDYGVLTKADRHFKTRFVFSREDHETQTAMLETLKLGCGHSHMGRFRKCSSCRRTMCEKCWLTCDGPVVDHLLSVEVAHVIGVGWRNTCTHCKEVNPNSHCPEDCPGRQKFSCTSLYSGRTGHSTGGRGDWGGEGPGVPKTEFFLRIRPWIVPRAGVVVRK